MKVNSIDARKYDAKQLNVVVSPPAISVNYEMLTAALLPTVFKTDIPLSHLKLTMYFRGKDRNAINRNMSSFMANFTEACDLELNGYKGKFRGYTTGDDYEDTVSKKRKKLNLEFDGYFYDDEIKTVFDGVAAGQFYMVGSRPAPCIVEVYAKSALTNYKISGFGSDEIVIERLAAGKTIIINGVKGLVTMDGANAFDAVNMWEFPSLKTGETNLTFTNRNAKITIQYMPMWL